VRGTREERSPLITVFHYNRFKVYIRAVQTHGEYDKDCILTEKTGVRQAGLVRGTGISKTVLSLLLSGKRDLTREHIRALSKYFDVDPAAFLGPA
jgi:antitoxin component HigA of HigAB toxin-antitoxin module